MTAVQAAAEEVLERLFERLPALAGLRGYQRDEAWEAAKREVEFVIEEWSNEFGDDDPY